MHLWLRRAFLVHTFMPKDNRIVNMCTVCTREGIYLYTHATDANMKLELHSLSAAPFRQLLTLCVAGCKQYTLTQSSATQFSQWG